MSEGNKCNILQQLVWFITAVSKCCIVKSSHRNMCSGHFIGGICQMRLPGLYQKGCPVGDMGKRQISS